MLPQSRLSHTIGFTIPRPYQHPNQPETRARSGLGSVEESESDTSSSSSASVVVDGDLDLANIGDGSGNARHRNLVLFQNAPELSYQMQCTVRWEGEVWLRWLTIGENWNGGRLLGSRQYKYMRNLGDPQFADSTPQTAELGRCDGWKTVEVPKPSRDRQLPANLQFDFHSPNWERGKHSARISCLRGPSTSVDCFQHN
ncbi:hypothetical protein B0T16DRAFT_443400 [Cercophora newfieldiana]|uniref:Uncharacterized protein n=1 Tax=Cercophora newfieldiana TaxID=92897 RepID=A0AA39YJF9_9PEZI|nr:hypothetical protein B0T16DRAFT_443400 [Cercophora newfieldiana]